jgi:peptide/nickel transport system permease protein
MDDLEVKNSTEEVVANDIPLDKNVRLMSPTQMLLRRFFRSKLSIIGLVMVIGLFLFCFLGPVVYSQWGETEADASGKIDYEETRVTYTIDGETYEIMHVKEVSKEYNTHAGISGDHLLGTDNLGYDVLTRLMHGGQVSLLVSFMTVILMTILGVIIGGIAGYFGGAADNVIMRICDVLMCLPGIPVLMILSSAMDGWVEQDLVEEGMRIYILMFFLTLISWPGIARLVRGQILSLREPEFMVAAEAMGYSTSRKIFKHLIPTSCLS